jgi:hypothetical protein
MQNVDMKRAANDNYGLLVRHPRLLTPAHERGCSRDRSTETNRDEYSPEDTCRELAVIQFRIEALNWIEFLLMKKRTVANDSQVRLSQSGREMAS